MKKNILVFIGLTILFIGATTCAFFEELVSPSDVGDFIYKQRDNAAPRITLSAPTNNQTVATNFQVSGSFFDTNNKGEDVKNELKISVIVKSKNNNWSKTFTISRTASIYSANVDVPNYGSYTVYAEAVDKSTNKTTSSKINIFVAEIPIVNFVRPVSNGNEILISSNNSFIEGTAYIAQSNITKVVLVFSNSMGIFTNQANGTTNWSYTYSSFVEGNNFVYAFAKSDNNKISQVRHINIVVDTQNPVAMIFSPTNNQIFYSRIVPFNGIAVDTGSGISNVFFFLNGATNTNKLQIDINKNWVFNAENLTNGDYTAKVYAEDRMKYLSIIDEVNFTVFLTEIYVSAGGNDGNIGTKDSPVQSMQQAMKLLSSTLNQGINGSIYVREGLYITNAGLNSSGDAGVVISNHNISLIGGWDDNFTTNTGYSVLDGQNTIRLIFVDSVTNISISGFDIRNGAADYGGGIHFSNVTYSTITNSIIQSNTAISNSDDYDKGGGGVWLYNSSYNIINATISSNTARFGGGIMIYGSFNTVGGNIYNNKARESGGGIFLSYSGTNQITASLYNNNADGCGGGICLVDDHSNTISGDIYSNTANHATLGGGGVYLTGSDNNTLSGNIFDNTANNDGGGVFLNNYNDYNTISGSIYNNTAILNGGGGIYVTNSDNNIISGNISDNYAEMRGGGVYINSSSYNTISGNILSNKSIIGNGGGIYLLSSSNNTIINATINYNEANGHGGGILFSSSGNSTISNTTIAYNYTLATGGGISFVGSQNVKIGALIYNNTASEYGGGVYFNGANSSNNIFTANCVITNNTATINGGGVWNSTGTQYTNNGFTISDNIAINGADSNWAGGLPQFLP